MAEAYVSVRDFKRLAEKVNRLLVVHEMDYLLTEEEKKLVSEAKEDIKSKRKGKFTRISEL